MATPQVNSRPSWPNEHAARIRTWVAYAPLAFVIVALLTLAVAPLLGFRSTQAYRLETESFTEPVRRAVTEIHLALAIEGDALNDFLRTRDSTHAVRYQRFAARNDHALARLDALAPTLGGKVVERTDTLRSALVRWRSVGDSVVRSPAAGVRRRLGREDEHAEPHEDALVAAARLDEAISRAAQERQAGASARERRQAGVTVVLALVALVATLAAGWVGRRLWRTTLETDARRAEVERLMEARARLMRGVTHDLRNPVQVITGHAGLLHYGIGGSLTPKQVESVDHIRRGARLLVRLIDDLTDLWRLEAGRLVVRRESADPGALVHAVVDGYRPVLESRGLQLVVDVMGPGTEPRGKPLQGPDCKACGIDLARHLAGRFGRLGIAP